MNKYLVLLLFCCFPFLTCTSTTTEEVESTTTLYADFYLRYLQAENQIKAQATFLSGDSLITATPVILKEGVFFQSQPMELQELQQLASRYQYTAQESYQKKYTYSFSPSEQKNKTHTATMSAIDTFSVSTPIHKSKEMLLTLDQPIQATETLVLLFTDENNKVTDIRLNENLQGSTIQISANKLTELPIGKGELYLVKKQFSKTQTPELVTNTTIEYYTKSIAVEVVK